MIVPKERYVKAQRYIMFTHDVALCYIMGMVPRAESPAGKEFIVSLNTFRTFSAQITLRPFTQGSVSLRPMLLHFGALPLKTMYIYYLQ